jgi:hydrogenase 3 maturation protease
MCIGNRDGGDDGIGPYVADKLKEIRNEKDFVIIDCGIVPENYTSIVKRYKPREIIIIDAVEMGLNPGEMRYVPKNKIGNLHISTHGIPLSVLINYLEEYVDIINFVGIQPKNMHGNMTSSVKNSGDLLIELIKKENLEKIEKL